MKVDLSIYNRILFGDLRPWDKANQSEEKFRKKLTASFKTTTLNITSFEKALAAALKDHPSPVEEEDYIFEIEEDSKKFQSVPDEIFDPLIDVQLPEPPNAKAEFYYILIRLEGTLLMNNMNKAIQISPSETAKKYTLTKAVESINSMLRDSEKLKKQLNKTQPQHQEKTNTYILLVLKYTLIRLQLEINELFESLLPARAFNETGIFENILKETPPPHSIIKDKVGLNSFHVRHYINTEKFNKQKTLDLIAEAIECLTNYFSQQPLSKEATSRQSVLSENILALENFYFANVFGYDKETHNFNAIISENYSEEIFSKAVADINENIEAHGLPNKRLAAIAKEEQRLSFLQAKTQVDESVFTLSIPRKLLGVLQGARAFTNANLSIDLSKLTEGKTPSLKTQMSVGELALLFRMLSELKPDVIDEKVKANIFRFISSNFTTKKSKDGAISTDKLSKLFNNPDTKSVDFWKKHISTLADFLKKV